MIVLRIDVRGHCADVRWAGAEAVLGSGPAAAIQRDDAGWAARDAVLVHVGDEVLIVRADGRGQWRLRLGDSVRLGEATLTLVGLLPLPAESPAPPEGAQDSERAWTPMLADDVPQPREPVPFPLEGVLPGERSAPSPAPLTAEAPTPAPTAAEGEKPAPRITRWRTPTFEEELAAAMRRSPWFLASLGLHALVIVALMVFVPGGPPESRATAIYGVTSATVPVEEESDPGGTPDAADPALPPEEYRAPEVDEPAPEDPPMPGPPSPDSPPRALPESYVPETDLDAAPPPAFIGPSRGALTARVTPRRASPKPAPPSSDEVVYEGEHLAQDARRRAAARVKATIAAGGGALGRALKGLRTEDILVVRGSFDHMEAVLEELGIPFTLRSPFELATEYDFSKHKLVFWNCGDWVLPPRFREPVLRSVRDWVHGGGYLFTTDWAVGTLLAPAFPGYLDSSGGRRTLEELVVEVQPVASHAKHALLEGVFDTTAQAKWWLESASFDVIVRDPSKVEVLVEAPRLAGRPYNRSSVIAATFSYGRGRVLHVMGHYDQQKGNLAGTVGVQRLPLNFVRMRLAGGTPMR